MKGIDLEVGEGELVCLIGANGAGKTTTLKAHLRPAAGRAAGRIALRRRATSPARRAFTSCARRGLAMVPEGRGIFAQLTIEENLAMGAYARNDRAGVRADVERVFTLFPRLKERRRADRRHAVGRRAADARDRAAR